MKKVSLEQELKGNAYPGRGIVIGRSKDGTKAVAGYFIMGRSQNSRNRVFVEEGEGIRTQAFDPSKLEDASLIIYAPVRSASSHAILPVVISTSVSRITAFTLTWKIPPVKGHGGIFLNEIFRMHEDSSGKRPGGFCKCVGERQLRTPLCDALFAVHSGVFRPPTRPPAPGIPESGPGREVRGRSRRWPPSPRRHG